MDSITRIHPIWKEAAATIAQRVQDGGYGFMVTWEELHELLELKERKIGMTPKEMDAIEFDKLDKVVNLSQVLLEDHSILIRNERNKGYRVLEPDLQVTEGWDRENEKIRKHLRQALKILNHVDVERLSQGGIANRDRNLQKTVFIINAANKRKLPESQVKKIA